MNMSFYSENMDEVSGSVISSPNERYYVIMKYHKKSNTDALNIRSIFSARKKTYTLKIKCAILTPINVPALKECREYKNKCMDTIREIFKD